MEQLIKVETNSKGSQVVSAKEVYEFLGYEKTHWSRWYKKNILDNEFAIEKEDYEGFAIMANGNETRDFAITIDFAKRLSMMARTEKGEQARLYFIECEKELREVNQYKVPKTFKEALLLAIEQQDVIEKQEALLIEQKPKVDFFDEVIDAKETFDIAETAKLLKLTYGRNTLFQKLKLAKVLMKDNEPYQQFIGNYFMVVESKWNNPTTGSSHIVKQTRVTQKGLDWLLKNKQKFNL